MSQILIQRSHDCITELYKKYTDNLYMTSKLQHYVSELPNLMANIDETRQQNIERMMELSIEQSDFIQSFLQRHAYFYLSSLEKFYYYDRKHYMEVSEDDVLFNIVSSISQERTNLMHWKHRTKVSTLKRIKDQSLLKTIPESTTIQTVLQHLYPSLFKSKQEAKYMLTILGDNILKKNSLIHFISTAAKPFLREMNSKSMYFMNTQCTQTFRYKYHEKHCNNDCRVVPILENLQIDKIVQPIALDILCVACHYSNRYQSSDAFLLNYHETHLVDYVMKLKQPAELVIREFAAEYFHVSNKSITWKNMLYLWKEYLRVHSYPANLYFPTIKKTMMLIFPFDEQGLIGIGSSHMPIVNRFVAFWTETVVDDVQELEIEEIAVLFRMWLASKFRKETLSDTQIIDLLTYYFPEVELQNQKFVKNKRCLLWDKDLDIEMSLNAQGPPWNEPYAFYCKLGKKLVVSKSYFETYMMNRKF